MKNKFKFSVIVPVYNVEKYLAETVESVINQTLGFEKNIQLILVNDGSPDNSADICREYAEKYPDNIVFVEKENGGVSSARNEGIEYIEGKYVNFLDSDDKWDLDAFKKVYAFFEKHYDEIDVVAGRVRFFEAKEGFHVLDYKFSDGTRIIDINNPEDVFSIQLTNAPAFIKSEAIGDVRFDTKIKYGEDSVFNNTIILEKCKYGIVKEAVYNYRKRNSEDSAVDKQRYDKEYYIDTLKYYYKFLFEYSKEKFGKVLPYIQSVVAYDLMWHFGLEEIHEALTEEELCEFFTLSKELLNEIDDSIIFNHPRHKSFVRKSETIKAKYNADLLKELRFENNSLYFRDTEFIDLKSKHDLLIVNFFNINKKRCKIELFIENWLLEAAGGAALKLKMGKKFIEPTEVFEYTNRKINTFNGQKTFYSCVVFDFKPKKATEKPVRLVPYLFFGEEEKTPTTFHYGKFIPCANRFAPDYQIQGKYFIRYFRKAIRYFEPKNINAARKKQEKECISFLVKNGMYDEAKIRAGIVLFKKKNKSKGDIWLISDRVDNAGDNGEVLFKYICENKPDGVRPIFVIGEIAKPEVKERLESIGEVIYYEDKDYPYYFLASKKVLSSSGADFTVNPFGINKRYFHSLFRFKYYYLQHGVTCADLSVWLNRYSKNIFRFYTSSERERQAILNSDYYYSDEQLVLTGQSRFDALYDDTKKQILILPTWRKSIGESYDNKTQSIYFNGFKNTEYFKFYNSLINDPRLLEVMRKNGYTGLFCLHPIHKEQYIDYEENDVFSVNHGYVDYNKVFAESALMVTDYSSVLFDFAYLRKPVIYSQFDKEDFFEGQIYDEGYFSYEEDGFGKVCYDLDSTVNELIMLIEKDCKPEEKYLERVNNFFAFDDKDNSKRILEAILKDDK